jgi:hypothetical protein
MSPRAAYSIVGVLVVILLATGFSSAHAQPCPTAFCTLVPGSFAGTAQNIGGADFTGRGQISDHAKCAAPAVDLGPRRGDESGYATYVELTSLLRNSAGEWVALPDTSVCLAMKRGSDADSAVWEAVTPSTGIFKVQISRPPADQCGDPLDGPYRIDNIRLDRGTITRKLGSCLFTTALQVIPCDTIAGTCPPVDPRTKAGTGVCPDPGPSGPPASPLLEFSATVHWENPDDPSNGCDPNVPLRCKLRTPVPGQPQSSCIASSDCASGSYCAKPIASCDGTGICTRQPDICITDPSFFDPVCGCDNKTYFNAGCAAVAGVNIQYNGQCQ